MATSYALQGSAAAPVKSKLPEIPKDCIAKYSGHPQRYNSAVQVKNVSHRNIIEIGESLHKSLITQIQEERHNAVLEAEKNAWEHAERIRVKDIDDLKRNSRIELEDALFECESALRKQFEGDIRRVRLEEKRKCEAALQERQQNCDAYLNKVVEEQKELFQIEKLQAVSTAVKSTQNEAAEEREVLRQRNEARAEQNRKEAERVLYRSLAEQKKLLLDRASLSANDLLEKERAIWREQMSQLVVEHTQQLADKNLQLVEVKKELYEAETRIHSLDKQCVSLAAELLDTREGFQQLLDETWPYNPGQAEFPLPPLTAPIPAEMMAERASSPTKSSSPNSKSELHKKMILSQAEGEKLKALESLRAELQDEHNDRIAAVRNEATELVNSRILELSTEMERRSDIASAEIANLNLAINQLKAEITSGGADKQALLDDAVARIQQLQAFLKKVAPFVPPAVQPPILTFQHRDLAAMMASREAEALDADGARGAGEKSEGSEMEGPTGVEAGAQTLDPEEVMLFATRCDENRELFKQIAALKRQQKSYVNEILITREEFQHFIDETLLNKRHGQGRYCMRPLGIRLPQVMLLNRRPEITRGNTVE